MSNKLPLAGVNATRAILTTIGVIFGIGSMNHGFFEALQGNKPTEGLIVPAIGEAHRFYPGGEEPAFTLLPNYLATGIVAMLIGLAIIVWSIGFVHKKHGRTVFLGLFILSFLFGGGIGQVAFFVPAWALGTRLDKPLNWWRKVLAPGVRRFLARIWIYVLVLASILILAGLFFAVFGIMPGVSDPEAIINNTLLIVLASAILFFFAFICGFAHQIERS